jgi:hypothetical protein
MLKLQLKPKQEYQILLKSECCDKKMTHGRFFKPAKRSSSEQRMKSFSVPRRRFFISRKVKERQDREEA